MRRFAILFLLAAAVIAEESERSVGTSRDSYVDAFKATHNLNKHENTNRDGYYPEHEEYPVYKPEYGPPVEQYGPPKEHYGPPKDHYGPPKDVYGPPQNSYEPHDAYGPPKAPPVYGPPAPSYGPPSIPFYGHLIEHGYKMPGALLGILDKFKLKLNLFTIGKIILKLVIFKKIVSLVAILCLLLFIPSLKHKESHHSSDNNNNNDYEESEDDEMRSFMQKSEYRINNITAFVMNSIENFGEKYVDDKCDGVICKSVAVMKYFNDKLPNDKLIEMYSAEMP